MSATEHTQAFFWRCGSCGLLSVGHKHVVIGGRRKKLIIESPACPGCGEPMKFTSLKVPRRWL